MAGAAADDLVHDHTVKAFLRGHGEQFVGQRQEFFGGKTEAEHDPPRYVFSRFDPLANLHLLLAAQQRHLAHLAQIHPHRVIQNIIAPPLLLVIGVAPPAPIHFSRVNDVNLQGPQLGEHLIQLGGGDSVVGQGVVEIVMRQVALVFGQAKQLFDLLGQVQAGRDRDRMRRRLGVSRRHGPRGKRRARRPGRPASAAAGRRGSIGGGLWGGGVNCSSGLSFCPTNLRFPHLRFPHNIARLTGTVRPEGPRATPEPALRASPDPIPCTVPDANIQVHWISQTKKRARRVTLVVPSQNHRSEGVQIRSPNLAKPGWDFGFNLPGSVCGSRRAHSSAPFAMSIDRPPLLT